MTIDSTAAAIEAQNDEREHLRAEIVRLGKIGDALFVEGYDQAVREIRDHFKKEGKLDVAAEIEKIWQKALAS